MRTGVFRKAGYFAAAFALAASGSIFISTATYATETISSDYTLTEDDVDGVIIAEGATVTINLSGHSITNPSGKYAIENHGNLTIVGDGAVESARATVLNYPGATAVLSGGTYHSTGNYTLRNYGTMIINSGVTVNGSDTDASVVTNGWYGSPKSDDGIAYSTGGEASLTINGGVFNSGTLSCAVIKNDDYGVLTINNGSFYSKKTGMKNNTVILNHNRATINAGSFVSEHGAVLSMSGFGTVADADIMVVNGGTFEAKDTSVGIFGASYIEGGNGQMNITDGEFVGTVAVSDAYKTTVSGGEFSSSVPEAMLTEDTETIPDGQGNYIIAPREIGFERIESEDGTIINFGSAKTMDRQAKLKIDEKDAADYEALVGLSEKLAVKDIYIVDRDGNRITVSNTPMTAIIELDDDLLGYDHYHVYYLNASGEIEEDLAAEVDGNGVLRFAPTHLSTYVIAAYNDETVTETVTSTDESASAILTTGVTTSTNPNTLDNGVSYIVMAGAAAVTMAGAIIYLMKREA